MCHAERGCGKDSARYARSLSAVSSPCLRGCPLGGSRPHGQPSSSFITSSGHASQWSDVADTPRARAILKEKKINEYLRTFTIFDGQKLYLIFVFCFQDGNFPRSWCSDAEGIQSFVAALAATASWYSSTSTAGAEHVRDRDYATER